MSDVISFRLNRDNPREAQVLAILDAWCSKGYSVRYVITEALLKLNDPGPKIIDNNTTCELNLTLDRIKMLLEKIERDGYFFGPDQQENSARTNLTDNFIASVRLTAKPGVKPCERG